MRKIGPDRSYLLKYLSFGEKKLKISAAYPEIICSINKNIKKEINARKIHSLVGKFAEQDPGLN